MYKQKRNSLKCCKSASKEGPCVPAPYEYARLSLPRMNIEQTNSFKKI